MDIVTCTGFGGTGSSAMAGIIREFAPVDNLGKTYEYKFLHESAGVADLEDAVAEGHRLKVDYAAMRFLQAAKKNGQDWKYQRLFGDGFFEEAQRFIDSLFSVKWHGNWYGRLGELSAFSFAQRQRVKCATGLFNVSLREFPLFEDEGLSPTYKFFSELRYECDREKFLQEAKKYTAALLLLIQKRLGEQNTARLTYIDQFLPPIATAKYQRYFATPVTTFVIDKDPRDLYLTNNLFWGDRFDPSFNVNTFIKWYRKTRDLARKTCCPNTHFFLLDDLIYDYERVCSQVRAILSLSDNEHSRKKSLFDPAKSRINTGLYRRYSNYQADIELIEKELKEYLSPYEIPQEKSLVTVEHPIKDLTEECDLVQSGQSCKNKLRLAVLGTRLALALTNPKRRKVPLPKRILSIAVGSLLFVPNVLVNLACL